MTEQEIYDNFSDEELKAALLAPAAFAFFRIKRLHKEHIDKYVTNEEVMILLNKQAATRWLKNQSK